MATELFMIWDDMQSELYAGEIYEGREDLKAAIEDGLRDDSLEKGSFTVYKLEEVEINIRTKIDIGGGCCKK